MFFFYVKDTWNQFYLKQSFKYLLKNKEKFSSKLSYLLKLLLHKCRGDPQYEMFTNELSHATLFAPAMKPNVCISQRENMFG